MQHIQGADRDQVVMISLDEAVGKESFVRAIDLFVNAIDMKSFGFTHAESKPEGRPAFHPGELMKLYLYGYRYGIRSSGRLQREARTNMEAMWLLKGLRPHYKTIANFRLVFTVYNLGRCVSILGMEILINTLKQGGYAFLSVKNGSFWSCLRNFIYGDRTTGARINPSAWLLSGLEGVSIDALGGRRGGFCTNSRWWQC